MADRKAFIVEYDIIEKPIFAKIFKESKVKYRKHAVIALEDLGTKIKFVVEY